MTRGIFKPISFIMIAAVLTASGAGDVAGSYPMPPRQTEMQKERVRYHTELAKKASAAATPKVLALFDLPDFRAGLEECCPEAAKLQSDELLTWFHDEVNVAELAHVFPAEQEDAFQGGDATLTLLDNYPIYPNIWQAAILDGRLGALEAKNTSREMNVAEEGVYACPSFANATRPTWTEAASRPVYTAHNLWLADTSSSPLFGNVTAVFVNSAMEDLVVMTPVDTGAWYVACDKEAVISGPPVLNYNCSGWDPQTLGTPEFHDHTILANWVLQAGRNNRSVVAEALTFFNHSAFSRNLLHPPAATVDGTAFNYWEGGVFGTPQLPQDLKFLIGQFEAGLFGMEKGEHLLEVARQYSTPVLWAFGAHCGTLQMPGKVRVLDPRSINFVELNVTLPVKAIEEFEELWSRVADARKEGPPACEKYLAWWEELVQHQVQMVPLTARVCSRSSWDTCIGADLSAPTLGDGVWFAFPIKIQRSRATDKIGTVHALRF